MIKRYFGIRRAALLGGLQPAMVDYLCRSNVLVPSKGPRPGRGRGRQYSFGDVVMLRALGHLLKCGISVAKLKKALATLRAKHHQITPEKAPRYLVTDGTQIYFDDGTNAVEELSANGQLAFAFIIKLDQVRYDISRALTKFDKREIIVHREDLRVNTGSVKRPRRKSAGRLR
jgi:DNA-binding transcriptional MerR regulator